MLREGVILLIGPVALDVRLELLVQQFARARRAVRSVVLRIPGFSTGNSTFEGCKFSGPCVPARRRWILRLCLCIQNAKAAMMTSSTGPMTAPAIHALPDLLDAVPVVGSGVFGVDVLLAIAPDAAGLVPEVSPVDSGGLRNSM